MYNLRIVSAIMQEYNCTKDEAELILAYDLDSEEDVKAILTAETNRKKYHEAVHNCCYDYLVKWYAGRPVPQDRLEAEAEGLANDLIDQLDTDWLQPDIRECISESAKKSA